MLERILKERESRVITLIHREETVSFLGIPGTWGVWCLRPLKSPMPI
jgi:hypothetical protein